MSSLTSFGSPIYFSLGPLYEALESYKVKGAPVVLLTDSNVYKAQKDFIDSTFADVPALVLDSGEGSKSLQALERGLAFLQEHGMNRQGALFVLGGGVMGDLGGFLASVYMRGIDLYQIPTSLLAMVDSAVGAKTAINFNRTKNLVGSFYPPKGTFIDIGFLDTLPEEDLRAAFAEIIKYGFIFTGNGLLELLEQNSLKHIDYQGVVSDCLKIKGHLVDQDPRDTQGVRAFLNLGHTFGHAIEGVLEPTPLHGNAVSVGMVMAAKYSKDKGYLSQAEYERAVGLIKDYGLPTTISELTKNTYKSEEFINKLNFDKKVTDTGKVRLILLKGLGEPFIESNIDPEQLHEYFTY